MTDEELREALNAPIADWQNVRKECADVGNFAMMLADIVERYEKRGGK